jgi:hypothetical protein
MKRIFFMGNSEVWPFKPKSCHDFDVHLIEEVPMALASDHALEDCCFVERSYEKGRIMKIASHLMTAVIVLAIGYSLGSLGAQRVEEVDVEAQRDLDSEALVEADETLKKLRTENQALRKVLGERNQELAKLEEKLTQLERTSGGNLSPSSLSSLGESEVVAEKPDESEEEGASNETEAATPLLASLKKMKDLDGGRRMGWRVNGRMNQVLGEEDLPEEQREKVKEMLTSYFKESEEINMLVLDPNVPAEEVLSKVQALHEEALNQLSLEVDTTLARELLESSKDPSQAGIDNLKRSFNQIKLSEEQEAALEQAAGKVATDMPGLAYLPQTRGGSSTLGPNSTWEEVNERREFASGVESLSALIEKSNQMRYDGQSQLIESLKGDVNFDEETLDDMSEKAERSLEHSQRGVQFIKAVESDPDVLKGMMKLRESMRGSGRGR